MRMGPLSTYGRERTRTPSKLRLPTLSPPKLSSGYALTDDVSLTCGDADWEFCQDFLANPRFARKWTGLRQDSGDPFVFAPRAKEIYRQLSIDHTEKTIIFSDSLNVEKSLKLKRQCNELGFKCEYRRHAKPSDYLLSCSLEMSPGAFGIGTFLSNDFKKKSSGGTEKSKALNMVIKLSSVDSKPTVKISDDVTKVSGPPH